MGTRPKHLRQLFNARSEVKRILSALLTASLTLVACGERAELDRRLDLLCKVDGGVRVNEPVVLPPEMFDHNNNVLQETRTKGGVSETLIARAYLEKNQLLIIKSGDPQKGQGLLQREQFQIIRISDGRVMAELVQYRRAGGDGFHLGHHTTNVCPLIDGGVLPPVFRKSP